MLPKIANSNLSKLSKNHYFIPLIIILAVGIPAAYAITITLGGDVVITGFLDMSNNKIINVGTPTLSPDAATKAYVDSVIVPGSPSSVDANTLDGIVLSTFLTKAEHVDCNKEASLVFSVPTFTPDSSCLANFETLDSTGIVGLGSSITIGTDGLPVISYRDGTPNDDLKVAHCLNVSCSGGVGVGFDTPTTVDSAANVQGTTSITIGTDGFPVISYLDDFPNDDLKVAHCTSIDCTTFDTPTAVDFTDSVGRDSSITIGTDGLPVISYHDSTNIDLKVAHCTNTSCSTSTTTTVESTGSVGQDTSITIGIDGFPVIAHRDTTTPDTPNNGLKVVHCLNVSCSGGVGVGFDTPTTLDSAGDVGRTSSITIGTDGFPVISHFTNTGFDLKVSHCTNTSCSTFDPPTFIDFTDSVGGESSITIGTDGFPVISYQDFTNTDLKVAHCTNTSCSTFDTPITVDSAGSGGEFSFDTSITIGTDGLPVISYFNTNFDLKFVHCGDSKCFLK